LPLFAPGARLRGAAAAADLKVPRRHAYRIGPDKRELAPFDWRATPDSVFDR
jgi:hypothetical protein